MGKIIGRDKGGYLIIITNLIYQEDIAILCSGCTYNARIIKPQNT